MALSKSITNLTQWAEQWAGPWAEPVLSWSSEHPRLATGALASGLVVLYCIKQKLTGPRLPPGPPAWPIVGSLFYLSDKMHEDNMKFRKQYGDVVTVWIGSKPTVMCTSYAAIKQAFLTQGNDFAGRAQQAIFNENDFQDEIFNATFSEKWSKDKKFALTCLRTLGGLKAGADGAIVEEISTLLGKFREQNQAPLEITELTLLSTTNIISGIIFNERLPYDDPNLVELRDLVMKFYSILNEFSLVDVILPAWLLKVISRDKVRRFQEALGHLEVYAAKKVDEHRQTYDPANPRDFVDMYLGKPGTELGKGFYDTVIAFLPDAIDSVSVFMRWIVLYLGHYPDVQRKAQAEIDEIVGPTQMVAIASRSRLKYTEAVLLEVMRICDASLRSTLHAPISHGITLRGYDIPKWCNVMGSFYCVHKDPELFPDPEKFDPQRFLDDNGDIVNSQLVMPFGVGRRMCIGESLVKLELFLFLANLLHNFTVQFPASQPRPSTVPASGFIQYPQKFEAVFVPRN